MALLSEIRQVIFVMFLILYFIPFSKIKKMKVNKYNKHLTADAIIVPSIIFINIMLVRRIGIPIGL